MSSVRQMPEWIVASVLGVGLFNTMLYVALNYTTAINVAFKCVCK